MGLINMKISSFRVPYFSELAIIGIVTVTIVGAFTTDRSLDLPFQNALLVEDGTVFGTENVAQLVGVFAFGELTSANW